MKNGECHGKVSARIVDFVFRCVQCEHACAASAQSLCRTEYKICICFGAASSALCSLNAICFGVSSRHFIVDYITVRLCHVHCDAVNLKPTILGGRVSGLLGNLQLIRFRFENDECFIAFRYAEFNRYKLNSDALND